MKKNLAIKIASISIVAVLVALVITTIILALVPKTMENPVEDGFANITVYQNGTSQLYSYNPNATTESEKKHNEIYNKILELHEESLEDNLLSAIFQGASKIKTTVDIKQVPSALNKVAEGNGIVFNYLQSEKMVLKIGGEVYKVDINSLSSSTIQYDTLIMPLGTSEDYELCTIYIADSSNNYNSSYQIRFLAHQAELNDYISGLSLGIVK